jgi:hypothetical protein
MDAILFAILFTIPGLMVRNIEKRLYTKTKEPESDFIKQYNFFIDSVFIYFLGLIVYQILYRTPIFNFIKSFELKGIFLSDNNLKLFIFYFIWALIICYPYTKTKRYLIIKFFLGVSNSYRTKKNMPIEKRYSSVWDEIFENEEEPITNDQIIVIEKDGFVITQGYIASFSPPHMSKREFLLEQTTQVKAQLEADNNLPDDEKLLNVVKMEYYDTNSGITIKFIDTTKLVQYLNLMNS